MALTILTTAIIMCLACVRTALHAAAGARDLREATIIAQIAIETTPSRPSVTRGHSGGFVYVVETHSRTALGASNVPVLCDRSVTVSRPETGRPFHMTTTALCQTAPAGRPGTPL